MWSGPDEPSRLSLRSLPSAWPPPSGVIRLTPVAGSMIGGVSRIVSQLRRWPSRSERAFEKPARMCSGLMWSTSSPGPQSTRVDRGAVVDVDGVVADAGVDQVAAGVRVDDVVALAARDAVGGAAAVDRVVADAAVDVVARGAAVDRVVALAAGHPVAAEAAEHRVVADVAVEQVAAGAAVEVVVARAAVEVVAAPLAEQPVGGRAADDVVAAAVAVDHVAAVRSADEVVLAGRAHERARRARRGQEDQGAAGERDRPPKSRVRSAVMPLLSARLAPDAPLS